MDETEYHRMFLREDEYQLLEFLKWLFGEDFFNNTKNKKHSAYTDYHHLIWKSSLSKKPQEVSTHDQNLALARLGFNSCVLADTSSNSIGNSSPKTFNFGRCESYGDERARKYIHDVKYDPKQYETLFTELCAASWFRTYKWDVQSMEDEGMPDFVSCKEDEEPIIMECKRMKTSNFKTYSHRVIEDAAKKFKRYYKRENRRYRSLLFIDASGELSEFLPRGDAATRKAIIERQTSNRNQLLHYLQKKLNHHSSVDWIIVFADQIDVFGNGASISRISDVLKNTRTVDTESLPISQYQLYLHVNSRPSPVENRDLLAWWPSMKYSIRRNSICSCGSGVRYKHCHGRFRR